MKKKRVPVPELKPEEIIAPLGVFDDLSEDEILYWSSPYYDELQYRKEEQERKRKELANGKD